MTDFGQEFASAIDNSIYYWVAVVLILLMFVIIIFYALNKFFEIKKNRAIASKNRPRLKRK